MRVPNRLRNPYLLVPAIAPHIAASAAGTNLEIAPIVHAYRELARRAERIVVEGAGGFLVPLSARAHMGDLAARLRLPIVLVVGMRLGCLSHALLTAEAIERRGLKLIGWVANRIDPAMRCYRDNVASLASRLDAPLVGEIAFVAGPTARRRAFDEALDAGPLAHWLARKVTNLSR
jgi:dethiobiotin synthetase